MKTSAAAFWLVMAASLSAAGHSSADDAAGLLRELPVSGKRANSRAISDVVIHKGGIVRGRFVDEQGTGIDGARIFVRQKEQAVATAITDARGEFSVEGLSSGVYRLETPTASGDYRFWQANAAPPAARPVALVVSQNPTLRGQYMYRNMDLLTLGMGAAGVTLGVIALDRADDAEARANRLQRELDELSPASP